MGLDIDAKEAMQELLEGMAGHLGHDMRDPPQARLAQQPLQVAPGGVLHFVEGTFHALAHAVQPAVQGFGVRWAWIDLSGRPDAVALGLPRRQQPQFVPEI